MGYIKLHRNIREWGWYDDPNTLALWIHLLVEANWKDGEWHGETVRRGQMITSVAKLAASTNLSIKQVRICLERLENGGEIVKEGANKWTKITVCKYEVYQCEDESEGQTNGEQTANKGQTNGKQRATIEEGKKEITEEEKKTSKDVKEKSTSSSSKFVKPSVEDVIQYANEHGYEIDAQHFVDYYESKGWVVGKAPMKDWKAAVRNWTRSNKRNDGNLFESPKPVSTDWLVEGGLYSEDSFVGHEDVLNSLNYELYRHVKRDSGALRWKNGKFIIA